MKHRVRDDRHAEAEAHSRALVGARAPGLRGEREVLGWPLEVGKFLC
jgi:hypothetical protein